VERHGAVGLATHELLHERQVRATDLVGRALAHDLAVGNEIKVIDDVHGFHDVVRDDDRGRAERVVELADELPDDRERDRVEAREGLVIHHEHRIEHHRARECRAPRHSSRKLGGHQAMRAAQPHGLELHQHEIADHALGKLRVLAQREGDVLEHRHVGEEGAELEEHAHAPAQAIESFGIELVDVLARDADAARGRPELAADRAEQRGLAGPARPHDRDHSTPRHAHRDALEDRPPSVGIAHGIDVHQNF
jgi:hypothetical protein